MHSYNHSHVWLKQFSALRHAVHWDLRDGVLWPDDTDMLPHQHWGSSFQVDWLKKEEDKEEEEKEREEEEEEEQKKKED